MKNASRVMLAIAACLVSSALRAQEMPGVSATEIKIGQTTAYSGPASAYSVESVAQIAYFKMLNEKGGIGGRKINLISLDDGYSPPKTVEQTRRLVESDEVAFIFQSLGTATSMAVRKYLNDKKVPQLFVSSGADGFGDYKNFPWTTGWPPSYEVEGRIFGKYVARNFPKEKIAVLYQNDDLGRDALKGFRAGLGAIPDDQIMAISYQATDPTVDSQIVTLKSSGATIFFDSSTVKFAAQAIRKIHELNWNVKHLISYAAVAAVSATQPSETATRQEFITSAFLKDPTDPGASDDSGVKEYLQWAKAYYPSANPNEFLIRFGYASAQSLAEVLKKCDGDFSRANVMKQALSLNTPLPMLIDGIKLQTAPDQHVPIRQLQLRKFDGEKWQPSGDIVSAD